MNLKHKLTEPRSLLALEGWINNHYCCYLNKLHPNLLLHETLLLFTFFSFPGSPGAWGSTEQLFWYYAVFPPYFSHLLWVPPETSRTLHWKGKREGSFKTPPLHTHTHTDTRTPTPCILWTTTIIKYIIIKFFFQVSTNGLIWPNYTSIFILKVKI